MSGVSRKLHRRITSVVAFLAATSLTTCRLDDLLKPGAIGTLAATPTEYADTAFAGSTATRQHDLELRVDSIGERLRFGVVAEQNSAWLVLGPATGVAPGTWSVTVDPTGLAAGDYADTLRFTAEGTDARELRVPVRLTLLPCAVTQLGALPTTATGQLTTADCASPRFPDRFAHRYRFAATANDSITFNLGSTAFGPSLAIFAEGSATTLVTSSVCAVAANAACARYVRLPNTGNYILEATSTGARATGAFDLSIGRPRPADAPAALSQGTNAAPSVAIAAGGTIAATSVRVQATLTDADLDSTRLEVELRPVGVAYTGVPTATGALGTGVVTLNLTGLADATSYKWRARAVDVTGRASAWTEFGGNATDVADVTVAIPETPGVPATLLQRKTDGITPIAAGGTTDETSIQLGATLTDPDAGDQLRLEVETRPLATPFTSTATTTSTTVASGGVAVVTVAGLGDGVSYHWQARTLDQTNRASAWVPFVPTGTAFRAAFPPAQLVMTVAPTTVAAGAAIAPAVQVAGRDGTGATLTSFTGAVTIALGSNPDSATLGGTLTVNAVAGIATFGDLTLDRVGTQYTLVATSSALTATSPAFSVTASAAQQLAFTTSPAGATAGATIAPAIVVRARDAFGNLAANYTGPVTLALATNGAGAVLAGTTTVAAVGGIATFSDVRIARASAGLVLVASATGLTGASSTPFTVAPAAATALRVATQPSTTASSGVAFAQQPVIVVEDAFGNRVAGGGVVVTASVATGAAATLANTQSTTDVTGQATFAGLALTGPSGPYTLGFAATGLTGTASGTITLGAGGPTRLALSVLPSTTVASGAPFAVRPSVRLLDAAGNAVPLAGVAINVAIATGAGTLGGTTSVVTDGTGEADFNDLIITGVTGARTLAFASTGLTGVTTASITVTAGAPDLIELVAGNGQTGVAGVAVAVAPSVRVRDASGNVVPGVGVTYTVTQGGGATVPAGVVTTNVNGLATLTSWTLGAGVGANALEASVAGLTGSPIVFTATGIAGGATAMVISGGDNLTGPVGTTLGTAHEVRVTDVNGNPVAGVTINWTTLNGGSVAPSQSVTDADGRATAVRTLGPTPGTQRTTATANLSGNPTAVTFLITATVGGATQMALGGGNTQVDSVGSTLVTPLSVVVRDALGNVVPGVLITWNVTDGGGGVTPATSLTNASGIATTSWTLGTVTTSTDSTQSVRASGVGTPVDFTATSRPGGVSSALSLVSVAPGSVAASRGTPATVTVSARDRFNNAVPNRTVTISASGAGNNIAQPVTQTDATGVTTAAIGSSVAGSHTIIATVGNAVATQQPTLTVVAAPAATLVFTVSPTNGTAATTIVPSPEVGVVDSLGNRNFAYAGAVTLGIAVNPAGGTLSGTLTRSAVAGVATFPGVAIDRSANGYVLIATAPGLGSATSGALSIASGGVSAARSLVSVAPGLVMAGRDTATVTVTARDANDNPVAGLAVTIAATGSANFVQQPVLVTGSNGVATGRFASTVAGARTISAMIDTVPVTATASVTVVPATVSPTLSSISGLPTSIVAGGTPSTITVTARDQFGNIVPGVSVGIAVSGSGKTVTQPAAPTDANGVATGTVASVRAEVATVTAIAGGVLLAGDVSLTIAPAAVSGTTSSVSLAPTSIVAGIGSSTVTVTARDAFSNLISGAPVVLSATGAGNTVTQPVAPTDAAGVATGTITSTATGAKVVSVAINGTALTTTPTLTVTPGAISPTTSTLALSAVTANAGGPAVTVTVTARDANGNPIAGRLVAIAATGTGNTVTQPAAVTDANGVATGSVSSTTAGVKSVSATIDGIAVTQTGTITVGAGGISTTLSTLSATPDTLSADGGASTVTVTVRDANGNAIAGATVLLAATGTGNTLTQPAAVTDANGVAVGSISSTAVGSKIVTTTVDGLLLLSRDTVVVRPGAISAGQSTLAIAADTITAAGASTLITVTARDANGNAIPGASVVLSATGAGNTLTQPAAVTSATGVTTGSIASTITGLKVVTGTIEGVAVTQADTVVVRPGAVSGAQSTLGVSNTVISAAVGSTTITVTVRDANGNVVPGATVVLAATGSGNTLTQPAGVTDANGQASGTLSSTVSEAKTISATAAGVPLAQTSTVTVVPDAVSAAQSTVVAAPATISADGGTSTITVTARDGNGNPVAGVSVSLSATGTGNTLTQPAAVTDANGRATGTISSTVTGARTISAMVNGVAVTQTASVTVTPGAVSTALSSIAAAPASISTDGGASTVTVTARDANGNVIPGAVVLLAATGSGITLTQPGAVTDAGGVATGAIASTIAGVKVVSAVVGGSLITSTVNVTATPGAVSATQSRLVALPTTISADGGTSAFTVTARDAHNNVIPGLAVTLAATGTGNTLTQPAAVTDAAGVATGSLGSTVAGAKRVSANVAGVDLADTVTVTVTAGALSTALSSIEASPATLTAGQGSATVTITARDAHGNPIASLVTSYTSTGTGNALAQPATRTDVNGVAVGSLASTGAGLKELAATIEGTPITMRDTVTVIAAAVSAAQSSLVAAPASITATTGSATITVTARDAFGNLVPDVAVLLAATGTGNTLTQPAATTDAAGVATGTIGSTAAGDKIITGTVNGLAMTSRDTVTVVAGAVSAATSTLVATPDSISTDGVSATVTVTARDDAGNPVPGLAVTLAATGTGNTLTQPLAVTNASGVATGTLRSTVTGEKVLSASIAGTAVTQRDTVTATPGAASAATSTLQAAPASVVAAGGSSIITVTARDANGNVIPGATVVLAATGTGNTLTQPATVTDANGVATGSLSSTVAGAKLVSATVAGVAVTQTGTVTVTSGSVSALLSTVVTTPTSRTAGAGASTITVTARDASGNAIAGATVVLAATGAGNTLTQPAGVTDANGVVTGSIGSTASGDKIISATIDAVAITQQDTLTITPAAVSSTLSTLVAAPTSLVAGGGASTITVTAHDAFGNVVPGAAVVLAATGSGNTLTQPAAVTDANGVATGSLASTVAGVKTVSATIAGTAVTQTADVTVGSGSVSATLSTLVAAPNTLSADGGASTITVTARDANGNAVAGVPVVLSATGSGNTLTQPVAVTSASGVATGSISSTGAGDKVITATIDGVLITLSDTVTVSSGVFSAAQSTVAAAPATLTAGAGSSTITVTVRDQHANPIAGATVLLSVQGSGVALAQPTAVTSASGVTTGSLASTVSGAKVVTATVSGDPITQTATVTVSPAAVSAATSTLTVSDATISAATGSTTITVIARDAFNNLVTGVPVVLAATGTGNTLTQPPAVTDSIGRARGSLASTVSESKTVSATADGVALTQTATVNVVPDVVSGVQSTLSLSTASIVAGGSGTTVTVTARDGSGNPVSGVAVVIVVTPSAGSTITQPVVATDASGVATGSIVSTVAGLKVVSAAVNGVPVTQTQDLTVAPGAISATTSTVLAAPNSINADGATSTVTVTARDASGNAIPGLAVVLAATGTGNTLTQPASVTNASGVATGTFSSTVTGDKILSATIDGTAVTPTDTVTVTPGAVSASLSTIVAVPNTLTAGSGSSTVTVTARDAQGNAIPGLAVVLSATGSGNAITEPATATAANGQVTGSFASTGAGEKVITATIGGLLIDQSDTVTVSPAAVSAAHSSVAVAPASINADDGSSTITVTARDVNDNPIAGATVIMAATGTGNTVTQPVAVTNASGVATGTLSSTAAGNKTVSATIDGVAITQSPLVTVTAGAISPAVSTVAAGSASIVAAAGSSGVTVTARDQHGNPIGGRSVVLSVTGTGNTVTQPAGTTSGTTGVATGSFSSTVTGDKVVSATIDGVAIDQTDTVSVVPGAVSAAQTTIAASPASVSADGGSSAITVTARDAGGNVVPGVSVVLDATGAGNTLTQPVAVTDADGVATGAISSITTGDKLVSATVGGVLSSNTATVTVTAGAISAALTTVVASPTSITAGLGSSTVTVTARDSNGNPAPGVAVVLAATGAGSDVTQPVGVTNASGIATGAVSATLTGEKIVSATVGGVAVTQHDTITVTPGAVSAATSTIAVAPASVSADGGVSTITVTARDANGNVINDAIVILGATGTGNTLLQPDNHTDANGQTTGSLGSTVSGSKVISATIAGTLITQTATITVTAGAVSPSLSTFALTTNTIDTDDQTTTITVTARDQHGNPIPGATVALTGSGLGNVFTQPPVTGVDGVAVGMLASTLIGNKLVSVMIAGTLLYQTEVVTVVAGALEVSASTIYAAPNEISADGGTSVITVAAVDAHFNPIRGLAVVLSATGTGNTLVQPAALTDSAGLAYGSFSSASVGVSRMSATISGFPIPPVDSVVVHAGAVSPTTSTVVAAPNTLSADGGSSTITVTVRDQHNNPVVGALVVLTANGTGNTLTQPPGTTDSSGVATGTFSSTGAGPKIILATAGGVPITQNDTLTVDAGAVTAGNSSLSAAVDTLAAGSSTTITAIARDVHGNPVPGLNVVLAATGTGNTLTQPAATTDASGVATGTLGSAVVGNKVISATIAGTAVTQRDTVTVVPGGVSATLSTLTVSTDSIVAGGAGTTITVTVRDASGNVIPGATVVFAATGAGNTITDTTVTANGSGVATATLTSVTSGVNSVSATANAEPITQTQAVTVSPGTASAATSTLTVSSNSITAGDAGTTVTVTARDAFGNAIPGATVVIAATGAGNTITDTTVTANGSGVATAVLTSVTVGSITVTATANGVAITQTQSVTVSAGAVSAATSTLTASSNSITAGDAGTALTVTARDASGNVVPGATVVFAATGLGNTITDTSVTADGSGVATAILVSVTTGTKTVSASANAVAITQTQAVTVTPGAVSAANSSLTVTTNSITAGDAGTTLTATARDAHDNVIPGATVVFTVSGAGNTITDTTVTADGNGVATATLTSVTVGSKTVSATANTVTITQTQAVTVDPGTATTLVVASQPTNVEAGAAISPAIAVEARDAHGNVATSFTGAVTLAIETGTGTAGAAFTGSTTASVAAVAGIATFADIRIDSVGTGYQLRATAAGPADALTASFDVTVGAASVAASVITVSAATVVVGDSVVVTLTARDALGNRISTGGLAVVLSLDTDGTSTGTFTSFADNGDGTYTAVLTGTTDGTASTILATIGGVPVTHTPAPTVQVLP